MENTCIVGIIILIHSTYDGMFHVYNFRGEAATGLVIRAESSFHEQGGVLLRVSEIIPHNKFDPDVARDYDYGLIRLKLPFGRAVPAILKNGPKRFRPGLLCQVMGWGKTTYSQDSKRVMTVSVPIVSQSTCRSAYEPSEAITPRMICAGYNTGEKDACEVCMGDVYSSYLLRTLRNLIFSFSRVIPEDH